MLTLALIGLVGGLITGVSPCVLPMLPIIFFAGASAPAPTPTPMAERTPVAVGGGPGSAGPDPEPDPPRRSRDYRPLKIIAGLVISFSIFTLTGSVVLSALGLPDDLLRWVGLVVLGVVGAGMLFPALGHLIERPFYRLPKISNSDSGAFVLGLGLGTLYVPCAGPILAAITVAGATGHVGVRTVVLTVSFATGAALPLLIFAAAGSKIRQRINAYRQRARGFRIAGGIVMIGLAIALAFNATDALQRAVPSYTDGLQKKIENSDTVRGALTGLTNNENSALSKCDPGSSKLASCGKAPSLKNISRFFNTPGNQPITLDSLKGKVVLVDFWAYSCINCQRSLPHVVQWYDTYRKSGFVVVGVHSPEFAFEKDAGNVRSAIGKEHIKYPVALDNQLSTFSNFRNQYWPADYLIDATGVVRHIDFGEGDYNQTESLIRSLLHDTNPDATLPGHTDDSALAGPPTAGDTPETYVSYGRSSNYVGEPMLSSSGTSTYRVPAQQPDDTFGLVGRWTVTTQNSTPADGAQLRLNYRSAKVYTVLGGKGSISVTAPGLKTKTIKVSGRPRLYTVISDSSRNRRDLTLTYHGDIQVYTFTFG